MATLKATLTKPPPGTVTLSKEGVPNRTLYIHNIDDKLRKDDLKRNLYMLFATYGIILDIIALRTMKMRGQAHVVFRDIDSSTQAMRALQGFMFFGKAMQIAYAKSKSDTIAKLEGTFGLPAPDQPLKIDAPAVQPTGFELALQKAVPVNEQERAKGMKRAREEEEEEDDDEGAEMDMGSDSD